MPITKIKKRDGRIVEFEPQKIADALLKAFIATGAGDGLTAKKLSAQVIETLEAKGFSETNIPNVENVQDAVEKVLVENKFAEVAKAYILYRQRRAEIREAKKFIGVTDELKLGVNAAKVLQRRYLQKDEKGNIVETPTQMFRRVAGAVAIVDKFHGAKEAEVERLANEFYRIMINGEFLPNSPTLMNAGTPIGQLSACFVLPVGDSLKEIFRAVENLALIEQSGGGVGFSFSRLRPAGDVVRSTMGVASGPVSFMRVFDVATEVIKAGGRRRGAMMGILNVHHPDILDFITAKSKANAMTNFNLSVAVDEKFMEAVEKDKEYELTNPKTKEIVKKIRAIDVFNLITTMAWSTGDPGLVFLDRINKDNPTPKVGQIESTNPCGEQPLLPFESCNLGSINLTKFVLQRDNKQDIDWPRLRQTINLCVHFLDNVIDANKFPMPEIERITKANRKIGLGVMGWADLLLQMGIPYDSADAIKLAEKIMKFIHEESLKASEELAKQRGSFPNFKDSTLAKKFEQMRNATVNTVAPTGSISIVAGCTSGIEPLFAIAFIRDVMEGTRLLEINPQFEKVAKEKGFYSQELMMEVAKKGSIQQLKQIHEDVRRLFVTALDIAPEWHVKHQAAFQKYVDNAVSKTVNLPTGATPEDVKKVYLLAYELGCKGITVYRYGSKKEQVLYIGEQLAKELLAETEKQVRAESEYSGGCPTGVCPF